MLTSFYIVSVIAVFVIYSASVLVRRYREIIETLEGNFISLKSDFDGLTKEKVLVDSALKNATTHINCQVPREGQVCRVDYTYNGSILSINDTLQSPESVMAKVGPCYLHNSNKGLVIVLPCTPYQIREFGNVKVGEKRFWTIEEIGGVKNEK